MDAKYNFEIPFKTKINERSTWENNEITFPGEAMLFYTDGSKTSECTGSGIYNNETKITNIYAPLGKFTTITQTVIYAIELCVPQ